MPGKGRHRNHILPTLKLDFISPYGGNSAQEFYTSDAPVSLCLRKRNIYMLTSSLGAAIVLVVVSLFCRSGPVFTKTFILTLGVLLNGTKSFYVGVVS